MQKYLYKDLYLLEDSHWWHRAKRANVRGLLLKFLLDKRPKILDVGCGAGKNVEEFSRIGPTWGIDNAKEAIEFCEKRGLKTVKLGNAEATNFPVDSFNIVAILDVLEHTNDRKTLKEAYRILKSKGLVVITVPAFSILWSRWDVVLHHKRRYTRKSLQKILEQQSFEILKISYMFSFLFIPIFIIRVVKSKISTKIYKSDFRINAPIINYLLTVASRVESYFIQHFNVPFGTSIICIARKQA